MFNPRTQLGTHLGPMPFPSMSSPWKKNAVFADSFCQNLSSDPLLLSMYTFVCACRTHLNTFTFIHYDIPVYVFMYLFTFCVSCFWTSSLIPFVLYGMAVHGFFVAGDAASQCPYQPASFHTHISSGPSHILQECSYPKPWKPSPPRHHYLLSLNLQPQGLWEPPVACCPAPFGCCYRNVTLMVCLLYQMPQHWFCVSPLVL